jgi:hypothetical protein
VICGSSISVLVGVDPIRMGGCYNGSLGVAVLIEPVPTLLPSVSFLVADLACWHLATVVGVATTTIVEVATAPRLFPVCPLVCPRGLP